MDAIKSLLLLLSSLLILPALLGSTYGQTVQTSSDFRIDIDIYEEDERKPPINIKTIFADGRYIELDDEHHRITVVDPGVGNITVLDSALRSRVSLEMTAVEELLNSMLQGLTEVERRKFSSNGVPSVEGDLVVLGNERMRYKFRPITPSNPNIAIKYGDFANWSVRINAIYNKTPPLLRMQLNQLLVDQRQVPSELRRITVLAPPTPQQPEGKTTEVVARMFVNEKLSTEDRTRVASVLKSMNEYVKISEKEFFRR